MNTVSTAQPIELADEDATARLGARLAAAVRSGGVGGLLALEGDLGAGKTRLVRALLRGLGHEGAVRSPTYTLVEPYDTEPPVLHCDLYRLADPLELEALGVRDALDGRTLVCVEWPERGAGVLPEADLRLRLEAVPGRPEARRVVPSAGSAAGRRWLREVTR